MTSRAGRAVPGVLIAVMLLASRVASAQAVPIIDIDQAVLAPGERARVTVIGPPGHLVALLASASGDGVEVGPLRLSLGADWYIVGIGRLDGAGRGSLTFTPAFTSTGAAQAHLQAAMTAGPDFGNLSTVALSPSKILRNAAMLFQAVGAAGPAGPAGAPGPAGPQGQAGAPGVSGYERVSIPAQIAAGATYVNGFSCPSGKRVLSGGIELLSAGALERIFFQIRASHPSTDSAWQFELRNVNPGGFGGEVDLDFNVWLVCATTQ